MKYLPILSAAMVEPARESAWADEVPAKMKRRDPRIWQLAMVAANRAIQAASVRPKSIVAGTALGALDETRGYLDGVFKDGFGSPRNFIASVHNSMAGKLAVEFGIDGPNLTVCEGQNSFASCLVAASVLDSGDFPALVLVVDENIELLRRIVPHLSNQCREFLSETWSEAAVAFVAGAPGPKSAPCLAALGPRRSEGVEPCALCAQLASELGLDASIVAPLSRTSDSFVKPAVCACERYTSSQKGDHLIGSYSPTADAAALVLLCV